MNDVEVRQAITWAHHEEWARVVAAPTRRFGDLGIAEEAAAEAFATAVEQWPADGSRIPSLGELPRLTRFPGSGSRTVDGVSASGHMPEVFDARTRLPAGISRPTTSKNSPSTPPASGPCAK